MMDVRKKNCVNGRRIVLTAAVRLGTFDLVATTSLSWSDLLMDPSSYLDPVAMYFGVDVSIFDNSYRTVARRLVPWNQGSLVQLT